MKTVIKMARIAGARDDGSRFEFELRDLEFLVALVRADEREACAREAESWDCHLAAAEIRARSNT